MADRLVLIQGDRASNRQNLDQLRSIRRSHPDLSLALVRRRVAWWQWDLAELRSLVDFLLLVDPTDTERAVKSVLDLARRHRVDGILTVNEDCLEAASEVAGRLDLPGCRLEVVRRCRDKWALCESLQRAGVPVPRCRRVESCEQALASAKEIGWPVVLKPRDMAASIGVIRCRDERELRRHYAICRTARWGGARHDDILVQEHLAGQTVAANALLSDGAFRWVCHSEKRTTLAPFFLTLEDTMKQEAGGAEIADRTRQAASAAGIDHGVVHVEMVSSPRGLLVLEVTPRMGGGFVGPMVEAHLGLDLLAASVDLALGHEPSRAADAPTRAVVGRYQMARREGRIARLALGSPDALPPPCSVDWCKSLGDTVGLPPRDYFPALGFIVAAGATLEEARRRLEVCERAIEVSIRPAAHPAALLALGRRLATDPFRSRLRSWLRDPSLPPSSGPGPVPPQ